jgi:hypothetical protein
LPGGRYLGFERQGFVLMNKFLISCLMVPLVACTSQTAVPIPTNPPVLTATPVETLTSTPTRTSVPTVTETPSPTAKPPDLILRSPDGEYIAEFENAYGHPYTETQIIEILDKDGSLLWEIPYQHETAMSDPHPSLTIYGWSKDSLFLYFYYEFSPDGGDRAFWWDGFDLQRINVQTGNLEKVIPAEPKGLIAFAFSPDETQIAYTREQDDPAILSIHNVSTGTEITANVISPEKNYIRVGDIHWSPSGQEIAYQTESEDYMAQTIYLDLSTMKQKVIREYMVDTSYFQGWSEDSNLEFMDIERGVYIVHVNPSNGETIVIGTRTPRP